MKIFILLVLSSLYAHAGGGGCADMCDQTAELMTCKAQSFIITDPNTLPDEWDQRNVETLKTNLKESFKVTFKGISKSYTHAFDPKVLYTASIEGLYGSIVTDRLKYPDYDYSQGYKVGPGGVFTFNGIASPGWRLVWAQFTKNNASDSVGLELNSIQTKEILLKAKLNCDYFGE